MAGESKNRHGAVLPNLFYTCARKAGANRRKFLSRCLASLQNLPAALGVDQQRA
jgi:hypothetical protein